MSYKNYVDIELTNDQRKFFDSELKHYLKLDKKYQTFDFKKYEDGDTLLNFFNDFISKKGNKGLRSKDKGITTIKKRHPEHFRKLEKTIDDILEGTDFEYMADDIFEEYEVMICDHKNGITSFENGYMIIPLWALVEKSEEFFKYYVCHELTHAIVGMLIYIEQLDIPDREESGDSHGLTFYSVFKSITPKNLWKYEINNFPNYKKYLKVAKVFNYEDFLDEYED